MDYELRVKLSVYHYFAENGIRPSVQEVAKRTSSDEKAVVDAYRRLSKLRMLVLEEDGTSIRMASPFSGVPTQHVVESLEIQYHANCAWDALGIAAALQREAVIHSRCEQSGEPLHLNVDLDGPEPSKWLFHCLVPAANWWEQARLNPAMAIGLLRKHYRSPRAGFGKPTSIRYR